MAGPRHHGQAMSTSFTQAVTQKKSASQLMCAGKQQQQVMLKLLLTTCAHERQVSSVHNAGLELELVHLQQTCKNNMTAMSPAFQCLFKHTRTLLQVYLAKRCSVSWEGQLPAQTKGSIGGSVHKRS